jgi:anti-anti-sigma factor
VNHENNVIFIDGELNAVTVPVLDKNNRMAIIQNSSLVFDLSRVTSSDNTGVALLVVLASFAKSKDKTVKFINLPKQLKDLIRAVGINDILPIN